MIRNILKQYLQIRSAMYKLGTFDEFVCLFVDVRRAIPLLTPNECKVVALCMKYGVDDATGRLKLSTGTVRFHLHNASVKIAASLNGGEAYSLLQQR
jgi:predicted DNA-binding protein (UPF0251 family)